MSSLNDMQSRIALFGTGEASVDGLRLLVDRLALGEVAVAVDIAACDVPYEFRGDRFVVDVGDGCGALGASLLDRLKRIDAISRERDATIIANCGLDNLDMVAACLAGSQATLLCDADDSDWAVAMALADRSNANFISQIKDSEATRLQRLSDEVARIAHVLSRLATQGPETYSGYREAAPELRAPANEYRAAPPEVSAEDVRGIVRLRRMRERFFHDELFADPAWDMLLDLTIARIEKSAIAVSSLCIAAAVPPTTALRWIKTMTENGMFVRVADPDDGRRVFIELSDATAERMMAYLGAAKAQGGLAI